MRQRRRRRPWRAVIALGLTQIIGWGTTYSLPAVLVDPIAASLTVSPAFVFAGISVMLLVNAASAPVLGPWIDRLGAARILTVGSIVVSSGLVLLGAAQGPVTYLLAWVVLGIAMATALSTPAYAALVEIGGRAARADIATLTLFTGFSSFLFWPLILKLQQHFDWRVIVWTFAALHILVCLPLHAFALPRRGSSTGASADSGETATWGGLDQSRERLGFWLVVAGFSAAGFVGWGLAQQLPGLFADLGLAPVTAIAIAGLAGPVQVAARAVDMAFGGRTSALTIAIGAVALIVTSLAVLAATVVLAPRGVDAVATGALVFIALWGTANGLITVARANVPLELFEPARFGTWMGRIALYQNIAFAAAPVVLAAVLHRAGPLAAVGLAAVFALAALAIMIGLKRLVASAEKACGG
ncbi:MAG: MFS transporter [Hyphomicrobiaceae bacterium]